MDRQIIYPGQIPLETDLLSTNKNTMIAVAKLAAAVLGVSTTISGLAVTPDSPASLNVKVAPGEIYSLQNIDSTAYSSIAADTAHQILKQGISLDTVLLNCPAPGTSGQSINYLIQATYQDVDGSPIVLPFYNASNPTQAYSGPNNSGTAQNTVRKGVCALAAKAGVAAATGSQVTPAPDSGYVGVAVVTVAFGQTTISAGNISAYAAAPVIPYTLPQLAFTALKQGNGNQPFPSGVYLQWGSVSNPSAGQTVTFPSAFLGNARVVVSTNANIGDSVNYKTAGVTLTNFTIDKTGSSAGTPSMFWIAAGY